MKILILSKPGSTLAGASCANRSLRISRPRLKVRTELIRGQFTVDPFTSKVRRTTRDTDLRWRGALVHPCLEESRMGLDIYLRKIYSLPITSSCKRYWSAVLGCNIDL